MQQLKACSDEALVHPSKPVLQSWASLLAELLFEAVDAGGEGS
jgi:hypothetical protein